MIKGITLTILLTVIVLTFYAIDFYFMLRFDPQRQQKGKGWSWDYTLTTFAAGVVVLLQPVILPKIAWSTDLAWGLVLQIIGGLSVYLSFVIHIWSRYHLRHFYTERVEVQADHQVIDTGPYALVRHPLIVSFFLLAGGVFFINPAITTLLAVAYTIISFTSSAKQEEELLSNSVSGYKKYMARVPRFLPRIWKEQ